jgi:hypothetical protein
MSLLLLHYKLVYLWIMLEADIWDNYDLCSRRRNETIETLIYII